MPQVLIAAALAIGSSAAAAGSAIGVTAGALAVGNLALAGAGLVALGDTVILGTTLGAIAGSAALFGASVLLAPKPAINTAGSPQAFKADPRGPITFIPARYGVGGSMAYETTSGGASKAEHGAAGNNFLTQVVLLGALGPYPGLESTQLDDTILTFSGQDCVGGYIRPAYIQNYNPGYERLPNGSYENNRYKDHVWQSVQMGALSQGGLPYPSKLTGPGDSLPEWTAQHGFNNFACLAITRSYDTTTWAGGVGQPLWTLSGGYPIYDPRKDSTYPSGSGPHRWAGAGATAAELTAARATWEPSDNPNLHALNFAMGFYLPDASGHARIYAGVGAGPAGVVTEAFIRAANVADANNWKITGQWTSRDGKRSVLAAMMQAGGAQMVPDAGRISCTVSTPLTALNADKPITWADMAGAPSLDTGVAQRERINTAFVEYTSEAHRWQVVQADTPVAAATYVAEDGGRTRSKRVTFEMVPSVDQASQLAAYGIVDGREIPNIVLVGKPHLRGYRIGSCLLVDLPEIGLGSTKLVVLHRRIDRSSGAVTLTCRTETDAKHAYALGVSGVAPATPSISGFDPSIVPAPIPGSWAAQPVVYTDASGAVTHVIRINGTTIDNVYATTVVVSYRQVITVNGGDTYGVWTDESFAASATTIDLKLAPGRWQVELHYITVSGAENVENTLDLGIITVGADTAADTAHVYGKPSTEVVADLRTNAQQVALEMLRGASYRTFTDALLYLNSVPIGTVVKNVTDAYQAGDQAIVDTISLLGAKSGNGLAFVLNAATLVAGPNNAAATTLGTLSTTVSGHTSSITDLRTATDGLQANVRIAVNNDKQVVGLDFGVNGSTGYFDLITPNLRLIDPTQPANKQVPFSYAGGVLKMSNVEIDTLKVGSVSTAAVGVNQITGVSSTAGDSNGAASGGNGTNGLICSLTVTTGAGIVDITGFATLKHTGGPSPVDGPLALLCDGAQIKSFTTFLMGGFKSQFTVGWEHTPGPGSHVYQLRDACGTPLTVAFFGYYLRVEEKKTSR